jgi:hypothetical protein
VLFPLGKPGVELGRVGEQSLVAVAHRRDVRIDGVREPRLELALADPAGAIFVERASSLGRRKRLLGTTCEHPQARDWSPFALPHP